MSMFLVLVVATLVLFECFYCRGNNGTTADGVRTIIKGPKALWNETHLDKLRNDVLTNYDKYARPDQHYDVTTVRVGLTICHIETDELNSTIFVYMWLKLMWTDSKLKWEKEDYGGIDHIKMADHEVWQPDIYLYNSASGGDALIRYGNPHAMVYSSGQVLWIPPSKFIALCEFDLYHWPFDTQHCYLKFVSGIHTSNEIKLDLFSNNYNVEFEPTISISTWEINSTAEVIVKPYNCCPVAHNKSFAQFNLTLTRKSSSYVAVVITPAVAVACLILIQCWLPFYSEERMFLNCCTAVMTSMLLIYFTQKVSGLGTSVPCIVTFYRICLYMICFSITETIFVSLIYRTKKEQTLPWNIRKHLRGKLAKWLLLQNYPTQLYGQTAEELRDYHLSEMENKIEEDDEMIRRTSKNLNQQEWTILAIAADSVLFFVYCFIFIVLAISYAV